MSERLLELAELYLARLKHRKIEDPEIAVYMFLNKPETKAAELLYDLAYELTHPRTGYCSYNDAIGFFELLIKYLEQQP